MLVVVRSERFLNRKPIQREININLSIIRKIRKWFEPRSNIPWLKKIFWVTGVLRRTVVSDWRFDNLCGSHLQSQVVVLVSWKFKKQQFTGNQHALTDYLTKRSTILLHTKRQHAYYDLTTFELHTDPSSLYDADDRPGAVYKIHCSDC